MAKCAKLQGVRTPFDYSRMQNLKLIGQFGHSYPLGNHDVPPNFYFFHFFSLEKVQIQTVMMLE